MKLTHYDKALKDYRSLSKYYRLKGSLLLYEIVPLKEYSVEVSFSSAFQATVFMKIYPSSRFVALNGRFPSRETIKKLISKLY